MIAFAGRERQDSSVLDRIGVVGVDGGAVVWLTGPGNEDFSPRWSPEGKQLVFVRSAGSCVCAPENLVLIRADGTGERQLTPYDGTTPTPAVETRRVCVTHNECPRKGQEVATTPLVQCGLRYS